MTMQSFVLMALASFAANSMAQNSAIFTNMTWDHVEVGQQWPISWTPGNGQLVSLTLGNTTWSTPIFVGQAATPSMYQWIVAVPVGFVGGNYTLSLSQAGGGTDYSPVFDIEFDAPSMTSSTANASVIMTTSPPMATVTYWDTDCGCHRTSMASAATGTGMMATPYTYFDDACGCTKTALAPAPTTAMCGGNGCSNYTAPTPTPMSPMPSTGPPMSSSPATTYSGGANRLSNSLFLVAVLGFVSSFA